MNLSDPIQQAALLLLLSLLAGIVDVVGGTIAALKSGTWSVEYVAAFVRNHVAGRVLPIAGLGLAALTFQALIELFPAGMPQQAKDVVGVAVAGASLTAWISLGAYIVETLNGLRDNAKVLTTKGAVKALPRDG